MLNNTDIADSKLITASESSGSRIGEVAVVSASPMIFDIMQLTIKNFSSLVKQERDATGETQKEFASRVSVSARTVQNIEYGKGNPDLKTVLTIINALGYVVEINKPIRIKVSKK